MSELTEAEIITKLTTIDAEIDKIVATLGTSGTGAVQFLNYSIGSKSVDGSERLAQLMEARKMYQELLGKVPKVYTRDHGYAVDPNTGEDHTEYVGDE